MSTKFGIPQRKIDSKLITDEDGELFDYIDTSFFGEVFFRANTNGYSRWLNPIAELLPDETVIYALDNTRQGIHTIGDAREHLIREKEQPNF
jgi:hypothetical protein